MNLRALTPCRLHATGGGGSLAGIFLGSRALTWGAAALALAWLPSHHPLAFGTGLWVRWDSGWYLRIAAHGYGSDTVNAPGFFPLYPGILAVAGRALGGRYALAGLLVSLGSCAAAFWLLWRAATARLGPAGGFRTVVYLAIFPTALFLQAVYPESLFLALALAAFACAEAGRWVWSGLAAGLALLTSVTGVGVVAGLVVLAWPTLEAVAWVLGLAAALFALFPLALSQQAGSAWAFLHAQSQWNRSISPAGPFGGIWDALSTLGDTPKSTTTAHAVAVNASALAFLVLFLALLPLVWRWFGAPYGVFALVALVIPLSDPAGGYPLLSLPRLELVVFPFFLALARLGDDGRVHTLIVALSSLLLGVAVTEWATYAWVA